MASSERWSTFDFEKPTYDLLWRAYPDGLPEEDYFALIAIFEAGMGLTAITKFVSAVSKKHQGLVYNDVLAYQAGDSTPAREDVRRVKAISDHAGYAVWLDEQDEYEKSLERPPKDLDSD